MRTFLWCVPLAVAALLDVRANLRLNPNLRS